MSGGVTAAYLRDQRDRPSVLKAKLSTFREKHPCRLVIVLEGKDDLPVYEVWLERAMPGIAWEPMLANGKRNSVAFLDLLQRDTTGLRTCTYFIIDHDYDGLDGRGQGGDVYLLPAYSIENLLVNDDVVESILRTDFQIVGDDAPEVRGEILARYVDLRSQFISKVEDSCARLFGARNNSVGNVVVRDSFMVFFDVTLSEVSIRNQSGVDNLVITESPVPATSVSTGREFIRSDPVMWVRGKYLFGFFKVFITNVFNDRRSDAPTLFPGNLPPITGVASAFDLGRLAARSSLPEGLVQRVRAWAEECERTCLEGIAA